MVQIIDYIATYLLLHVFSQQALGQQWGARRHFKLTLQVIIHYLNSSIPPQDGSVFIDLCIEFAVHSLRGVVVLGKYWQLRISPDRSSFNCDPIFSVFISKKLRENVDQIHYHLIALTSNYFLNAISHSIHAAFSLKCLLIVKYKLSIFSINNSFDVRFKHI